MSELTVFLAMSCWSGPFASFYSDLAWLRERYTIYLFLIDNGADLPSAQRQKLQPDRHLIFPLRLASSQVLSACLDLPVDTPLILWWQAESQWNMERLPLWIQSLHAWTAIHPGNATSRETALADILPSHTHSFPACLLFEASQIPTLRDWLSPQQQMPLMLLGVDPQGQLLSPLPEQPLSYEPALSLEEGQKRLHMIKKLPTHALRRRALLESLYRAFPGSTKVLKELLPLLPLPEAIPILQTALTQKNFQPDLLAWCSQALLAADQPESAIQSKNCLDCLYPGFRLKISPWPNQKLQTEFQGPQQESLTILLLVDNPCHESEIQRTLKSIAGLKAEIYLLITAVIPPWAYTQNHSILSPNPQESLFAFQQRILTHIQSQWILLIKAGEELLPDSLRMLQQWLWLPPMGRWAVRGSIRYLTAQGSCLSLYQEIRLFRRQSQLLFKAFLVPDLEQVKIHAAFSLNFKVAYGVLSLFHCFPSFLQTAFELAQQAQWEKALPLLEKGVKQMQHVPPSVYFTWMRALLETHAHDQLEKIWSHFPVDLPQGPDFWYLRGAWLRRQGKIPEARQALERCLHFSASELQQLEWYSPDCLNRLPLLELKQLYWQQLFLGSAEINVRLEQIRELRRVLYQLFKYYPEGIISVHEWSLELYLCLVAILGAHYQPGSKARDLFLQSLPESREQSLRVFYLETALLYLEGQFGLLADRLPPGQSYESMRELQQNPAQLLPFTAKLWQHPEVDGPEIATAFLVTSALAYRDVSYLIWLVRLQQQAAQCKLAEFSLNMARQIFPDIHLPKLSQAT